MNEINELYQQLVIDHNKHPANFGSLATPTHHGEGINQICGDKIFIDLIIEEGKIVDIRFSGDGCAIAKSSASIMTAIVKGKTIENATSDFESFRTLVTTDEEPKSELGKMLVFKGVREFPARVKCASLAWHTLISAINNITTTTTE